ncbi:hypothetical protein ABENE_20205 [Asticcacaulis benevestitus DSM 16100 = ATCC BAA-896]|uniref:Uncharacterized protein n=1 Tax=Asticcacaulis benevestitus DSM 16100 = ATCC BAA-896 TaxID=1121022 RepID=V4NPD0_9CAUL|nr:hypothetical protein ABENE_20205 [Asticcacaulis benevestitus DSM 16100 = ATCC BAA-896]
MDNDISNGVFDADGRLTDPALAKSIASQAHQLTSFVPAQIGRTAQRINSPV